MKYFHLVWAALFRRKTRTILTLLSVLAAFLLFGMLDAVRVAFNSGGDAAGVDRMVVSSKYSIIQGLPQSLVARVQATPGVKNLTWANWFGGYYQEPRNQLINFAIGDDYFEVYPDYGVTPAMADALARSLIAPAEIPVGILTALVGGPVFISLLVRERGRLL